MNKYLLKLVTLVAVAVVLLLMFSWSYVPSPICVSLAVGRSMEPSIPQGSLVIGFHRSFAVGDVVIAEIDGRHVVHRVMSVEGNMVITKGDANEHPDEPVEKSSVKCVVTWVVPPPYSQYVLAALYISLIYVLCAILYILYPQFKYPGGHTNTGAQS